jgi:hypothetical protein
MSSGIRGARSVLAAIGVLGGVLLCGGGFGAAGVQPALAGELPVTTSVTGNSYSVSFSGDAADLSFTVNIESLTPFATGGGWIVSTAGAGHASFGFVAHLNQGRLVYIDHRTGSRLEGDVINSLTECVSGVSQFEGTDSDGNSFAVVVDDNGKSGASDTFTIIGTDGNGALYSNSGVLVGGDIQAHCPVS